MGVVFVAFATDNHYLADIKQTALSVREYTLAPCVCVAVAGKLLKPHANESSLQQVPVDIGRFPIDRRFCGTMKGWRIVSFIKTTLLYELLSRGQDVFSIDGDWRMRANMTRPPADVVAFRDHGQRGHYFNVGLMYVRSTPMTRRVMQRAANRSYAAWDQSIINEEFAASNASCCVDMDLLRIFTKNDSVHNRKKSSIDAPCVSHPFYALPPPNKLSYPHWNAHNFNVERRVHNRCTNACHRSVVNHTNSISYSSSQ